MEGWRIARSAMRQPEMDAKRIDRQCPFGISDKRVWLSIIPLLRYYGEPLPFGNKIHEVLAPTKMAWLVPCAYSAATRLRQYKRTTEQAEEYGLACKRKKRMCRSATKAYPHPIEF